MMIKPCSWRVYGRYNLRDLYLVLLARWLSRYRDWIRAGRSWDRISVGARFSAPVQTGPGAHPTSCTIGTGSFPVLKSGRGVGLTTHPLLVPWSRKSRAIPLLPLWAVRPVQSLCLYNGALYLYLTCLAQTKLKHGSTVVTYSFRVLSPLDINFVKSRDWSKRDGRRKNSF